MRFEKFAILINESHPLPQPDFTLPDIFNWEFHIAGGQALANLIQILKTGGLGIIVANEFSVMRA